MTRLYTGGPGIAVPPPAEIGRKAFNLARLAELAPDLGPGVAVPAWVVVRAGAAAETEEFRAAVLRCLEDAGIRNSRLAVRSSATEEDGSTASFAGQFFSVLGVDPGQDGAPLWEAIRQVCDSTFAPGALAYRDRSHLSPDIGMAVIVQEMVEASSSGVAFSVDPVSGDWSTVVVSAVHGLGEGLVSGELDADTFWIPLSAPGVLSGEVRRDLRRKERAYHLAPHGGTQCEAIPEPLQDAPAITDEEAAGIADTVRTVAEALDEPQDVEWALSGPPGAARRLWLLQTRPITAPPRLGIGCWVLGIGPEARSPAPNTQDPTPNTQPRRLWDNSNIVESYAGVTTPLTFSFARAAYEEVYRQFCRLMGVPESVLEEHRDVFAAMLGLVRGRIYYNLLNWYRALALLPGYRLNRSFMERMMGVREKLEDPPEPPRGTGKADELLRCVRTILQMVRECRRLRTEVPAFHARVESALAPLAREDLGTWSAEDLGALYRRLERDLLHHWRTPIANDFFAMLFFGALGRLAERWIADAPPSLGNALLCGEGGIISTEPAIQVMALARHVTGTPALGALFACERDDTTLWHTLAARPELAPFCAEVRAYIDRFGDRCANELKLETRTLAEDPRFLIRMVRTYAAQGCTEPEASWARERKIRDVAEAAVRARLRGIRRWLFMAVLAQTRLRVRDRENLRFERTRVFGRVRRIFIALGERLAEAGRLASPRDVFYLTKEELFAEIDATAVTRDLQRLVAQRRAEFARYEEEPPPPDRFETFGPPNWECGVRAPVRIVRDPHQVTDLQGCILAAERTDPGWTLLFPAVQGLLIQRGSLLSHSAIVAREMGIPCIVSVAGLLDQLQDGDRVEMDGATGLIRRLRDPESNTEDGTADERP